MADELRRIATGINTVNNLALVPLAAEPARYSEGDVVYADGTNWNPGSGAGAYIRSASAWVAMAGGGIANVVEDTSPQLGGDLDSNGFDIIATSPDALIIQDSIASFTGAFSADDGGWYRFDGDSLGVGYGFYFYDTGTVGVYDVSGTTPGDPPTTADTPYAEFTLWNTADWGLAGMGFYDSADFQLYNAIKGASVELGATATGGAYQTGVKYIGSGAAELYHSGSKKLSTAADGIDVTGDVGGTTIGGITEANLLDKSATEVITGAYTFGNNVEITGGNYARVYNAAGTSYGDIYSTGKLFYIKATNVNDYFFQASGSGGGVDFIMNNTDGAVSMYIGGISTAANQDGHLYIAGVNSADIYGMGLSVKATNGSLFSTDYSYATKGITYFDFGVMQYGYWFSGGSTVYIRDAGKLRIQDTGDTDYEESKHDGVDFLRTYVNTTDTIFRDARVYVEDDIIVEHSGAVRFETDATGIGFFAATPAAKPTVTGSRGGNAALASLLTGLATLGLITDSST